MRGAADLELDAVPPPVVAPRVPHAGGLPQQTVGQHDFVPHPEPDVRLTVPEPRYRRDRPPRDDLFHERHAASPTAARHLATHVEPEVDFVEIPVTGIGAAAHSRIEELEADEAHERAAAPAVELQARGNERPHERGVQVVIEHGEVSPARREKRPLVHGGGRQIPSGGGSQSSNRLPSGSVAQPNRPFSDSSIRSWTAAPAARSWASIASRSWTR
jgi:hypothetical protein